MININILYTSIIILQTIYIQSTDYISDYSNNNRDDDLNDEQRA